jgi:hypothetical protein
VLAVSRQRWATRSAIDDGSLIGDGWWSLDRVREAMESPSTIYLDGLRMGFGFDTTIGSLGDATTNRGGSFLASWLITLGSGGVKV